MAVGGGMVGVGSAVHGRRGAGGEEDEQNSEQWDATQALDMLFFKQYNKIKRVLIIHVVRLKGGDGQMFERYETLRDDSDIRTLFSAL